MPCSVAIPCPRIAKVTPDGKAPVSLIDGVGLPVVVTVKAPAVPTVKAAVLALVIAGGSAVTVTVRVKDWVASGATPLVALMVSG